MFQCQAQKTVIPGGRSGKAEYANFVPLDIDLEILLVVLGYLLAGLKGHSDAKAMGTNLVWGIGQRDLLFEGISVNGHITRGDQVSPAGKIERDLFALEPVRFDGKIHLDLTSPESQLGNTQLGKSQVCKSRRLADGYGKDRHGQGTGGVQILRAIGNAVAQKYDTCGRRDFLFHLTQSFQEPGPFSVSGQFSDRLQSHRLQDRVELVQAKVILLRQAFNQGIVSFQELFLEDIHPALATVGLLIDRETHTFGSVQQENQGTAQLRDPFLYEYRVGEK